MKFYGDDTSMPRFSQYGSDNYDFSFLDEYIQKVTQPVRTNPNQIIESGDGFYDEQNEDEEVMVAADEEIINSPEEASEESFLDQEMSEYLLGDEKNPALDYLLEYQYGQPSEEEQQVAELSPGTGIAETHNNPGNLKFASWMEKYGAKPGKPGTDGGQFAAFPDVNSAMAARTELLSKPLYANKTVDEAMKLYSNKGYDGSIYPEIRNKKMSQLTNEEKKELTRRQIIREDRRYATKLGIKQTGGVALTPEQQYVGLNNPYYDALLLPLTGWNTIRGLDSGEPVAVEDEFGNNDVLYGPNDTVKLKGTVREKRLRKRK